MSWLPRKSTLLNSSLWPLSAISGAVFVAATALAADAPPSVNTVTTKHMLADALHLQITNRGLLLFHDHLQTIISNQGLSLSEAYFDGFHWQSAAPIDLTDQNLNPQTQNLVSTVTSTLHDWLTGFPLLTKVQPVVDIGASGFRANITKLSLSTDEALLHQMGQKEGVVLVIDAEIKEIDAQATQIRVWDATGEKKGPRGQELPVLGKAGFDQPVLKIGGGPKPLTIRMPFLVQIDNQGTPVFKAIGIEQNLDQIDVTLKYKKVVVPDIEVLVNGVAYKLDQATLDKTVQTSMPGILQKIRSQLHDFANNQLPGILNQMVQKNLVNTLEQVQTLEAPGANPTDRALLWGLQLDKPTENNDLEISLSTYVEDPLNPNSNLKMIRAPRAPVMNDLSQQNYDVAIAIDEGMINRMLQLSFERGNFSHIPVGGPSHDKPQCVKPGSTPSAPNPNAALQLLSAPQIIPLPQGGSTGINGETLVKVHANLNVPNGTVTGILGPMLVHDGFTMTGDLILKLKRNADPTKIDMLLWDFDPASLQLDPKDFTALGGIGMLKDQVISTVKSSLADMAAGWRCNGVALPGTIQVPEVLGIGLNLQHLMMESTGNFVLYLQYNPTSINRGGQ